MQDDNFEPPPEWAEEDETIKRLTLYLERMGLKNLAAEIHDLKYVNRGLSARLAADYWSLSLELNKLKEDRIVGDVAALQSSLFDKSSSYNTVVMSLGYAGFFAIWNSVHQSMSTLQNSWVAVLLGFSLLIFIAWTLINSIAITLIIRRRAVLLANEFESRQDFLDAHLESDQSINRMSNRIQRFWPFAFILSAMSGLAAGVYLLVLQIELMVGLDIRYIFIGLFRVE